MNAQRAMSSVRVSVAGFVAANFAWGGFEEAGSIAPSDLGAIKWTVSETAGAGEVVVFRMIRRIDGKVAGAHDEVCYRPGEPVVGTIFAINPDFFRPRPDGKEEWHLAAFGGSAWIQGKWSGKFSDGKSVGLKFISDGGKKVRIDFQSLVMKHGDAAGMYRAAEQFPAISDGGKWTWGGTPIISDP